MFCDVLSLQFWSRKCNSVFCKLQLLIACHIKLPFQVVLSLCDDDSTRSKWNHGFKFLYRITLKARALVLDVEIANTGDTDWDFTLALHTYFRVPDATR